MLTQPLSSMLPFLCAASQNNRRSRVKFAVSTGAHPHVLATFGDSYTRRVSGAVSEIHRETRTSRPGDAAGPYARARRRLACGPTFDLSFFPVGREDRVGRDPPCTPRPALRAAVRSDVVRVARCLFALRCVPSAPAEAATTHEERIRREPGSQPSDAREARTLLPVSTRARTHRRHTSPDPRACATLFLFCTPTP